jgi:AraC-like DNA-binding protein
MRLPDDTSMLARAPVHWPPVLATRGPGSASTTHVHHAMHVVLARTGTLRVRDGTDAWRDAAGVITAADVPHAIDGTDREVVLVFVDPESEVGEALGAAMRAADERLRWLSTNERDSLVAGLDEGRDALALMRWSLAALDRLVDGATSRQPFHPRVRKLVRWLRTAPPHVDTSLAALAAIAGLSESRLVHAFTASLGTSLKTYLLWLKLQRAAIAIVAGERLTEAALRAGFADAAHMTRTFRRMFGVPPSALRPRGT